MSEQSMYDKVKPEKADVPVKSPIKGKGNDNLIIIIVAAVIILAVAAILCYYFIFRDKEVVATYDGGKVTRGEYEVYYRICAPMLVYYGYNSDVVAKYIAEKIILDKIVRAEAEKEGITLTDEMKAETDELFNETVISEYASMGININDVKEFYYNDSLISAYLEKKQGEATAEDMKAYLIQEEGEDADFNIYNTQYMVFKVDKDASDEDRATVKQKAEEALAKVNKGEDFAKVAEEYTDDTSIEFKLSDPLGVDDSFVEATQALKVGAYTTKVVESANFGYFIIKLNSIEENGRLTDSTQVNYYVNSFLYAKQDAANCKYYDDKISSIATTIGRELGLITTSVATE